VELGKRREMMRAKANIVDQEQFVFALTLSWKGDGLRCM